MFLSRLNEISGGCEKITPVSGSLAYMQDFMLMKSSIYARLHAETWRKVRISE